MITMKHLLTLFFIFPLITSCEVSENKTTELEGVWETECIGPFSIFNATTDQKSNTISMTFKNSNIETNVKTFTDNQCALLESTLPSSEPNNLFPDNKVATSFSIGDSLTASNGLPAKEIDLTLEDGEIYLSIFQLQDDGNSLLFGGPCLEQSQEQGTPLLGNVTPCINGRPIEIGFSLKYLKQ